MEGNGTSTAILVLVAATFALDMFGTFTSSPQTTELNAKARADTLMKWVKIAGAIAIVGGAYASAQSGKAAPVIATTVVAVGMYVAYAHARDCGLRSDEPATEDYAHGF